MKPGFFECKCPCGETTKVEKDGAVFTCPCGRKSVVDFSLSYTVEQLEAKLDSLNCERDKIAWLIEKRRRIA